MDRLLFECRKQLVDLYSEASVRFVFLLGGAGWHVINSQIVLVKL